MQLSGAPKATGAGTGTNYGDTLSYDRTANAWIKAVAGSLKPFGFNGTTTVVSQVQDMMTGITTSVRGTLDADPVVNVVVKGRIEKIAGAVINPGELVMLDATSPVTKVMEWNGTSAQAVVGRYIRNITQHHNADTLPATAANDAIIIDVDDAMVVGP